MSNPLFIALGLLTLSLVNLAPQSSKVEVPPKPAETPKVVIIVGTTFDEKNFVNENDMKILKVANPVMLRGLAGNHLRITGQLDPSSNTLLVKSIRAVEASHTMKPSSTDYMDPKIHGTLPPDRAR
jgi:hypothetical protein